MGTFTGEAGSPAHSRRSTHASALCFPISLPISCTFVLADGLCVGMWTGQFSLWCPLPQLLLVSRGIGGGGLCPQALPTLCVPPASWDRGFVTARDSPSPLPGEQAQKEDTDQQEDAAGHCQQRNSSAKVLDEGAEQADGPPMSKGFPKRRASPVRMQLLQIWNPGGVRDLAGAVGSWERAWHLASRSLALSGGGVNGQALSSERFRGLS